VNEDDEASVNEIEIDFPGIGTISGDFYTSTVGASANHDDSVEQTVSLQSTGVFTFVPEST
jgi:predicted secreted protein